MTRLYYYLVNKKKLEDLQKIISISPNEKIIQEYYKTLQEVLFVDYLMCHLNEQERIFLEMRYFQRKSTKEIQKEMFISRATCDRINKKIENLYSQLAEEFLNDN